MNLLSYKTIDLNQRLTLEKLNKAIRSLAREKHINLSIFQSHCESKTVTHIQRNKNKIDHIIISPGPWSFNAFIIKDILEIIKKPFSIILDTKSETIFDSLVDENQIFISKNYVDAYLECINSI
tara:strand:- start:324 stop:695 length:372 start_codon:yes stop_codon:yes gene_type:complete